MTIKCTETVCAESEFYSATVVSRADTGAESTAARNMGVSMGHRGLVTVMSGLVPSTISSWSSIWYIGFCSPTTHSSLISSGPR